jgi:hypothetical protein
MSSSATGEIIYTRKHKFLSQHLYAYQDEYKATINTISCNQLNEIYRGVLT